MRLKLPKRTICVESDHVSFNGCTGKMYTYQSGQYEAPRKAGPWANDPSENINEKSTKDLLEVAADKDGQPFGYFIHDNLSKVGFLTQLEREANNIKALSSWWLMIGGKKRGLICAGPGAYDFKGKAIPKFIVDPHISAGFGHMFESGYLQYRDQLIEKPKYVEAKRKKKRVLNLRKDAESGWLVHLSPSDGAMYYDWRRDAVIEKANSRVWSTERHCIFQNEGLPWWETHRRLGYEDCTSEMIMDKITGYNYQANKLYFIAGSGLMRASFDSMRAVTVLYERAGYADPCTEKQWTFTCANGKTVYYKVVPFVGRSSHGSRHPMFGAVLCTKPLKFRKIRTSNTYDDLSKVAMG